MRHPFGWCSDGVHKNCRRARVSHFGVYKGLLRMCGCDTDGCPCAVMNHWFPEPVEESSEETPETGVQAS